MLKPNPSEWHKVVLSKRIGGYLNEAAGSILENEPRLQTPLESLQHAAAVARLLRDAAIMQSKAPLVVSGARKAYEKYSLPFLYQRELESHTDPDFLTKAQQALEEMEAELRAEGKDEIADSVKQALQKPHPGMEEGTNRLFEKLPEMHRGLEFLELNKKLISPDARAAFLRILNRGIQSF